MGSGDQVLSHISSGGVTKSMVENPTLERSKHAVSSIVETSSETQHQNPENQHQNAGNNKTKVVHVPPFPLASKQSFYPPLPVHL